MQVSTKGYKYWINPTDSNNMVVKDHENIHVQHINPTLLLRTVCFILCPHLLNFEIGS